MIFYVVIGSPPRRKSWVERNVDTGEKNETFLVNGNAPSYRKKVVEAEWALLQYDKRTSIVEKQ